jgi:ornithine cyclodeaminase/alanine dehydrogenase-like protein (mu-crystallin family)
MDTKPMTTDDLLQKVLRVSPEPYEYFNEKRIHDLLTDQPLEYYRFVKDELTGIAKGRSELELPAKQVFSDPSDGSDFRVMPCVIRTANKTTKTIKIVGTNTHQDIIPDQITVGKAFAVHPTENFVSHIFEACLLSSARTGICSTIAIDLLARARNKVTIYGAGRVGYYAAFYAAALGGVSEVTIIDIDHARAEQSAALLNAQIPSVRFLTATKEETTNTDVLILATTSTTPICSPPGLGANLIVSLGADTDYQAELSPQWASLADIFIDTKDCLRFGDIQTWKKKGVLPSDKKILGLLDLLGEGDATSCPDKKQRVFVSTGSALFDNLTIGYLLDRTQADNAQKIKT